MPLLETALAFGVPLLGKLFGGGGPKGPSGLATDTLRSIVESGGLTHEQRAILSAAGNRRLGKQAQSAGSALERRLAAQGIAGSGLGNAAFGGILSGLLGAQQGLPSSINQQSLNVLQNALRQLFQSEREMALQRAAQPGFGDVLGEIGGVFGGKAAELLATELFK